MPKTSNSRHDSTTSDSSAQTDKSTTKPVRIDRWLWAARFYKTRSLAKAAIEGGKVHMQGQRTKPAKEIHIGYTLQINRGLTTQEIIVEQLSEKRGPASEAVKLYAETLQSVELRENMRSQRAMQRAGLTLPSQKPSKKDRRDLRKLKSRDLDSNEHNG